MNESEVDTRVTTVLVKNMKSSVTFYQILTIKLLLKLFWLSPSHGYGRSNIRLYMKVLVLIKS